MTVSTSRVNFGDNGRLYLGNNSMLLKEEVGSSFSQQEQSMASKTRIKGQQYFFSPYRTASQSPQLSHKTMEPVVSDHTSGSKHWLGPPKSLPPDKRWQHISTYLKQCPTTPRKVLPKPSAKQPNSPNTGSRPSGLLPSIPPLHGQGFRNSSSLDIQSNFSLHPSFISDETSSLYRPSSQRLVTPTSINFASAPATPISQKKKTVHFAPARDSFEVVSPWDTEGEIPVEDPILYARKIPVLYMPSADPVDQLPTVVEKYMVKSYPVLPAISPSSNVIYVNEERNALNPPSKSPQASSKQRQRLRFGPPSQEVIREVDENASPSPVLIAQRNAAMRVRKASHQESKKPSPTNMSEPRVKTMSTTQPTGFKKNSLAKRLPTTTATGFKDKKPNAKQKVQTVKKTSKSSPATTATSMTDDSRCETPSTPDPMDLERKRLEYEEMMKTVQNKMYEFKMRYSAPRTAEEEMVLEMDNNNTELLGSILAGQLSSPTPPPPED